MQFCGQEIATLLARSVFLSDSRLSLVLCVYGAVASAQTRVVTLGTQGGPLLALQRSQPENAVVVEDRIYLVDAGNGVARQILAAGLSQRKVDRVFATHNHDEHNADWGTVLGLQWSTGRSADMHLHGPKVRSRC